MDFLKEILGEELFQQVSEKVNAHNGNEANKDKQVKVANLAGGDYVSKAKHDALQALLDGKVTELDTANGLIADLKKSVKGDEALQGKVTTYETQVAQLQEQLRQTQIDSELKIEMLAAGAKSDDIDYLIYKLNSKGEKLELGDDGHIKGVTEMIEGLKVQHPSQFDAKVKVKVDPMRLPETNDKETGLTKEEFNRMGYKSRVELKASNPELYNTMMKG